MSKIILAGDIGGTHIRFGVVRGEGNILHLVKTKIERKKARSSLLNQLISSATQLIGWANEKGLKISGVGIGIAGKIDPRQGKVIFSPNLPEANGQKVSALLSEHLRLPVFIDNDANVFGRGEAWRGEGRRFSSWVGITLGTGVGGCVILDGKLWPGEKNIGFAGEIGHTTVYPQGLPCACGKEGCLEAYASEGGLLRRIERENLFGESENITSAESLYKKALEGNPIAKYLFKEFGIALGIGIANAFTILGIRNAIIGGGVSRAWDVFKDSMLEAVHLHCSMLKPDQISIVKSKLGDKAAILGAAKLVLDNM